MISNNNINNINNIDNINTPTPSSSPIPSPSSSPIISPSSTTSPFKCPDEFSHLLSYVRSDSPKPLFQPEDIIHVYPISYMFNGNFPCKSCDIQYCIKDTPSNVGINDIYDVYWCCNACDNDHIFYFADVPYPTQRPASGNLWSDIFDEQFIKTPEQISQQKLQLQEHYKTLELQGLAHRIVDYSNTITSKNKYAAKIAAKHHTAAPSKIMEPCRFLYTPSDNVFINTVCSECWAYEYTHPVTKQFITVHQCMRLHPGEEGWKDEWNTLPLPRNKIKFNTTNNTHNTSTNNNDNTSTPTRFASLSSSTFNSTSSTFTKPSSLSSSNTNKPLSTPNTKTPSSSNKPSSNTNTNKPSSNKSSSSSSNTNTNKPSHNNKYSNPFASLEF
jgi:hypothetical protein